MGFNSAYKGLINTRIKTIKNTVVRDKLGGLLQLKQTYRMTQKESWWESKLICGKY
jgi:hypothetical protein